MPRNCVRVAGRKTVQWLTPQTGRCSIVEIQVNLLAWCALDAFYKRCFAGTFLAKAEARSEGEKGTFGVMHVPASGEKCKAGGFIVSPAER